MELGGGAWANDIRVKSLRVHCYFQSAIGRPPDEGDYGAGVEELSGYDSMYSHYKSAQLAVHMSRVAGTRATHQLPCDVSEKVGRRRGA